MLLAKSILTISVFYVANFMSLVSYCSINESYLYITNNSTTNKSRYGATLHFDMYALRIWYAQRQILIKKGRAVVAARPPFMRYET